MTSHSRDYDGSHQMNLIGTNDVDYSQWQRQRKLRTSPTKLNNNNNNNQQTSTSIPSRNSSRSTDTDYQNSHNNNKAKFDGSTEDRFAELRKECSTRCRHGPKQLVQTQEIVKKEKKKSKDSVLTLLKVQIQEKKGSLQESKQRYLQLIRDNVTLKEEITSFESETHKNVKSLLGSYRRYKDGLSVLGSQHSLDLSAQKNVMEQTKTKMNTSIQILKEEINDLDKRTEDRRQALKVLLNYKEKEYPEQMEHIKMLKEEIDRLRKIYDQNFLGYVDIANGEKSWYQSQATSLVDTLKSDCAQEAMNSLDVSVKKLAQQNEQMKREIEIHGAEERKHNKEIEALLHEIRKLKAEEKERFGRKKHPQMYMQKCLPNAELDLDIPLQTGL